VPEALPVSRLSYSGLAAYRRCGYRFYLDRALRLPAPDDGPARAARGGDGGEGLAATTRGTVVHQLLEELDFGAPAPPAVERVGELIEATGSPARPEDVTDIAGLVAAFAGSALAARIGAADRVHAELPFAFTLDTGAGRSLLIDGIVDVHARTGDDVLVVDYKSDRLEGAEPAERIEAAYAIQRLVYALAALRSGAARAEVAYCFLERADEPVTAIYEAGDEPALEAELRELTAGVAAGRFVPTDTPHRALCADCPGRPALCSWDESHTLSEDVQPLHG
jgi:ATP-dependent helicase/nuclease subunit A